MAKKKNKTSRPRDEEEEFEIDIETPLPEKRPSLFSFLPTFRAQAVFIGILAFAFYINTFNNQYALDDDIIIVKNQYVQQGFGGIKDIMTKDAFDSFYRQMQANKDQLSGGRYRPLSIVTFAIEQNIFGTCYGDRMKEVRDSLANPFGMDPKTNQRLSKEIASLEKSSLESNLAIAPIRHTVNVILFVLSMVVMLYLLRTYFFPSMPDVAFLATLLFTIHPIHTEAIANVKSRDEILSLLFICLTFIYAFRWRADRKGATLLKSALFYFLALLSKEWGITLLALIPVAYVCFRKEDLSSAFAGTLPFVGVALLYLGIHMHYVPFKHGLGHEEVLNNPYVYASKAEGMATKIFVLLLYFVKLIWPWPLSADYSYNTIPYTNFSDPVVWSSVLIHLGMIIFAFRLFTRKNPMAFALFSYLAFISMVSNFVFDIGASMGERLLYHASFGFMIYYAYCIIVLLDRVKEFGMRRSLALALCVPLILLCGFVTIPRNAQWENDHTLFIHDAKVVPHAIMANGNAGKAFIELADSVEREKKDTVLRNQYYDSAMFYLNRAIAAHMHKGSNNSGYYIGYVNLGYIYYRRHQYDKCEEYWNRAAQVFPRQGHANFWKDKDDALAETYHTLGLQAGSRKDFVAASKYLEKSVTYASYNSMYWTDYGGANYELKDFNKAAQCWYQALTLDPTNQQARGGYKAVTGKDWGTK